MRRFELVEGSASKFWEIEQAGSNELNIRWGRIGRLPMPKRPRLHLIN